ncbi:MAG: ATP-binding cassette domain-containing protein [Acidobacteria bacterium]|nr:ATP-binding cassette domain-containing protein [Acidobacteriota bacterium]
MLLLVYAADSCRSRRSSSPRPSDPCRRRTSLAARYPHELSGGEQQRAALARAVVGRPRLFLLDEPLSSLDPELRSTLRAELVSLQRQLGITAVYVTHDRDDATALGGRIVQMRDGRIVGTHPT